VYSRLYESPLIGILVVSSRSALDSPFDGLVKCAGWKFVGSLVGVNSVRYLTYLAGSGALRINCQQSSSYCRSPRGPQTGDMVSLALAIWTGSSFSSSRPSIHLFTDEWSECRSDVSVPLSAGNNDRRSGLPCNTSSTWPINVRRYHSRRHRHGVPLPCQLNVKQATRTLQKPRILIPLASVAQNNRPVVTSEERSSGSLLTFSHPAPIASEEDGDADGGRTYGSSGDVNSRERLRRDRIALANKGRVPWNKGRRHSPGIDTDCTGFGRRACYRVPWISSGALACWKISLFSVGRGWKRKLG